MNRIKLRDGAELNDLNMYHGVLSRQKQERVVGCIERDAHRLLLQWLLSYCDPDDVAGIPRSATLAIFMLLAKLSPDSRDALIQRGAAGTLYSCVERDEFYEHSDTGLFQVARLFAAAHPGGAPPASECVVILRSLSVFADRIADLIEAFHDTVSRAREDAGDDESGGADKVDGDGAADDDSNGDDGNNADGADDYEDEEDDAPELTELKTKLTACLREMMWVLQHGPPLPRASVRSLALPVLQRVAAHFACDAERHRDVRGALASVLAAVFADSDDVEAVFEGGLFDFAWRMFHYGMADGQQHPSEALVAVMTRVAALPAATLERVFTSERVACAHAVPGRWVRLSDDTMAALSVALARFAAAAPALAGQMLKRAVLFDVLKLLEDSTLPCYALQAELAAIAARYSSCHIVAAAAGASAAGVATELLQLGAVECCAAGLGAVVFGGDALGENTGFLSNLTDILRAVRKLSLAGGDAFLTAFVKVRGPQLLDLLRYTTCTQQAGPALQELTEILTQLESTGITLPVILPEEQRSTAVADMCAFTKEGSVDWEAAFDAHLACSLEEGGHPQRGRDIGRNNWAHDPAPSRVAGAPSTAALALLQARARERLILSAHATMNATDAVSLVALQADVYNPGSAKRARFLLLVAPDDARLPSHAMHFRAATARGATGWYVHRCFRPPGQPAGAALPYLALHSKRAPCATGPIAPVPDDIVYGEHAPAAADAEYAPGTVLVRPWAVRPAPRVGGWGASDLPTFLVYRPCAAHLLPGAVPVGHVVSCTGGDDGDDEEDFDEHGNGRDCAGNSAEGLLFNDTALACFDALAAADHCGGNGEDNRSNLECWAAIGIPYFKPTL